MQKKKITVYIGSDPELSAAAEAVHLSDASSKSEVDGKKPQRVRNNLKLRQKPSQDIWRDIQRIVEALHEVRGHSKKESMKVKWKRSICHFNRKKNN